MNEGIDTENPGAAPVWNVRIKVTPKMTHPLYVGTDYGILHFCIVHPGTKQQVLDAVRAILAHLPYEIYAPDVVCWAGPLPESSRCEKLRAVWLWGRSCGFSVGYSAVPVGEGDIDDFFFNSDPLERIE